MNSNIFRKQHVHANHKKNVFPIHNGLFLSKSRLYLLLKWVINILILKKQNKGIFIKELDKAVNDKKINVNHVA